MRLAAYDPKPEIKLLSKSLQSYWPPFYGGRATLSEIDTIGTQYQYERNEVCIVDCSTGNQLT